MKDIETVTLELTPYEAAILRHAIIEVLGWWPDGEASKAIETIDDALCEAGIKFLSPDEVAKRKIIHD